MARVKVRSAEQARRKRQSAADKAKSKSGSNQSKKKASKGGGAGVRPRASKVGRGSGGLHPYTKLILDPCHAPLVDTPLPGREGSSLFRLPFRRVLTVPSTTVNVNGASAAGLTNQTALAVVLTPSSMSTTVSAGTFSVNFSSLGGESDAFPPDYNNANWGIYGGAFDPSGLASLNSITSLMRPVAACVKLEFYSCGSNTSPQPNSGTFIGYEGVAGQLFTKRATTVSGVSTWLPTVSLSGMALQGCSHTSVTQGVEAKTNYASCDEQWQDFKQMGAGTGSTTGSADTADVDCAAMPIAMAAVAGAQPGTQYIVSGAIVYEWVPSISLGVGALGAARPSGRSQSILDKVAHQVAEYGPMLVGVASSLAVGGPSLAISDLFSRLAIRSSSSVNISKNAQNKVKWQ